MSGYRADRGGGARVRTDIVECHVVRVGEGGAEFLQLRRTHDPLRGTWQPVLGHCEPDERSVDCVMREVREEVGLDVRDPDVCEGLFALEQVRPFYVWGLDAVVLGPRFAALTRASFEPVLNAEHDASRWITRDRIDDLAFWPGQREAIGDIVRDLLQPSAVREALRVRWE